MRNVEILYAGALIAVAVYFFDHGLSVLMLGCAAVIMGYDFWIRKKPR